MERNHEAGAVATLLIDDVSRERAREGAVFVMDDGEPVGVVEKPSEPPSTLVPLGVFVFSAHIFDALERIEPSDRSEYELSDAVDRLFDHGAHVETVGLEGWLTNVNTAADVERVSDRLDGK